MVRLIYLLVLFCLMELAGCAGSNTGYLNVRTPSASNAYVVQVDTIIEIVKGKDHVIDLDSGEHRVRVSYVGHIVTDTVVLVKGRRKNAMFGAWMGGMALGAGVMTALWTQVWLYLLPPVIGAGAAIVTMPQKTVLEPVYRDESPVHLYRMDQTYIHINRFHNELGATDKFGFTGISSPVGVCYDNAAGVLWAQRDPASLIYPLKKTTDYEVCVPDAGSLHCVPENNKILEAFPCH